MKLIVDLEKKTLRILENERSIFRGEKSADKLELYINKTLENEYPTITALLSNGRKIGPYSTDSSYGSETIDGVTYTTASFTLSKENGFTLSEGKMQITIWMNTSTGKKEAIGNVLVSVINTTAFDDGDIIISGDVEGTIVNYRVELENLQGQVNTFNGRLNNVETNKADKSYIDDKLNKKVDTQDVSDSNYSGTIAKRTAEGLLKGNSDLNVPNAFVNSTILKDELKTLNNAIVDKADKTSLDNYLQKTNEKSVVYATDTSGQQTTIGYDDEMRIQDVVANKIPIRKANGHLVVPVTPTTNYYATSKKYVDDNIKNAKQFTTDSINDLIGGAPTTLDTLKELADAFADNKSVVEALNTAIGSKANQTQIDSLEEAYNELNIKVDNIKPVSATEITYAELKALRDNGQLVIGNTYIITDYQCTTIQENTRSAGHQFDIIVTADSPNKLNEVARARLHKGDTYFATSKLEAWKLKYSLDNDTSRFAWADEVNGKGVIYWMKDEFNNECPYDFKNIQFYREDYGYYFYTFSFYYNSSNDRIIDTSIFGNDGTLLNDEESITGVYGNVIKEYRSYTYETPPTNQIVLNNIIFIGTEEYDIYYYGCSSNTFGNDCSYNTFGSNCNSNTFGSNCNSNTFGDECSDNTFGNSCNFNTFGYYCSYNSFGYYCSSNTFGSNCNSNTFGNDCSYNTFGNDYSRLTLDSVANTKFDNEIFKDNPFTTYVVTNESQQVIAYHYVDYESIIYFFTDDNGETWNEI